MHSRRGFTLLEMVVAMAIFAILAGMVSAIYVTSVRNQDKAKAALERLGQVQLSFVVIGRAVEQIADRPIRDSYGETKPALSTEAGLDAAIEFTQTGKTPSGLPGSTLARVGFGIKEEKLFRYAWKVLDRAPDSLPLESLLLEGVKAMEFRFMDDKAAWHNGWPPDAAAQLDAKPSFPRAIEVTLELADWGKLTRIFMLPDYVPPAKTQS